jgi:signal transduction histidine kinase
MPVGSQGPLSEQDAVAVARGRPVEATSKVQQRYPKAPAETDEAQHARTQRAAIVGQLTGGVLHDFNNVLTVITGMIDILAEAVADEPQLASVAKLIDEAASRGAALTARLLAFARGQPSLPLEVDVGALLAEAARLLRPTLGGVEVDIAALDEIPIVLADPGQLTGAILSLAIAARNAMQEGGKLTLGAGIVSATDGLAHARASEADDEVAITVDAHGYGEVANHPESIFSDVDVARDFTVTCGGRLVICAPAGANVQAWIMLPKAASSRPWLAGS